MTLFDTLKAISHFTVGASAQYPVLSLSESHARESADAGGAGGLGGEKFRRVSWRIRSCVLASSMTNIPAALETLQSQLARRGEAVTITEVGGAPRVMPAGGVVSGSLAGYPRVGLEMIPERSIGAWQYFDVVCETIVPIFGGDNLVEHTWTRDTDINNAGIETVRQKGRVVVANTQDARTWAETNVVDPARTAAETAEQTFVVRWTETADDTTVEYEYSVGVAADTSGGIEDIEEVDITDRTVITNEGRVTRTISGTARGEAATTLANSYRPTPGTFEVLNADEVSQPRVPDGRVEFRFELLTGREDTGTPGVRIISYSEQIAEAGGGKEAEWRAYLGASPIVWSGPERPYIYQQRSRMEFIGPWANGVVTPRLSTAAYLTTPRVSRSVNARGVKSVEVVYTYIFTAVGTLPAPYEPVWS